MKPITNDLYKLHTALSNINFDDIAALPTKDQPKFVDHLESLQDQLSKNLFANNNHEETDDIDKPIKNIDQK